MPRWDQSSETRIPEPAQAGAVFSSTTAWTRRRQPEGELRSLPANHSCYRRDVLLGYGDRMEDMLEAEWVLQGDLLERGFRLYQDLAAKSYHLNYAAVSAAANEYFIGARIFAAERAAEWSACDGGFLYAAGSPVLPLIRAPRFFVTPAGPNWRAASCGRLSYP